MRRDAELLDMPPEPRPHRWTATELYQLVDMGFFADRRVELIEGEIVDMAAQSNWHAIFIKRTDDTLSAAFGPEYWIRVQMSLDLSPFSVPDPDIAVIKGSVLSHLARENPKTALLIAEISETTLLYDRTRKGSLYARVGIADYWIVNVEKRFLEVYRDPGPDANADFGFSYRDVKYYEKDDEIEALALPGVKIRVGDILL